LPILIETHRATITQDSWRTVRMVERNPEVRFNGDFSHWYTGLEWPYGDVEAKLAFISPVLERVRFFHGRVGNSSHIQLPWEHPSMPAAVAHLREFWTRSMVGFLRDARPGDYLPFTPELLTHAWNYAPLVPVGRDRWVECGDRWADALAMAEAAKGCWVEAQRRLGR
jgi:hypothetical protein